MSRGRLMSINWRMADLTGARLLAIQSWNLFAQKAIFHNVDATGANLEFGRLTRSEWNNANMTGVNLEMAWFNKAKLNGANLQDANLQEVKLNLSRLRNANPDGANLRYGNFQSMDMHGCTACPFDWAYKDGPGP